MWKYIYNQKPKATLLLFLTSIYSLSSVFFAYLIQNIIDSLAISNEDRFASLSLALIVFLIINYFSGYLSTVLGASISKNIRFYLKRDVFSSLIKQKHQVFISKTTIGDKLNIFENDIELIEQSYFKNLISLFQSIFLLIASCIYLFSINFLLGIFLIVFAIVILFFPILLGKSIDKRSNNYSIKRGEFLTKLEDFFSGFEIIKSYSIEKVVIEKFSGILLTIEKKLYSLRKKVASCTQAMIMGNYLIIAACLVVGGSLTLRNHLTLGQLIAVIQIMNIIVQPMGNIGTGVMEIKSVEQIRFKLERIIESKNKQNDKDFNFCQDSFKTIVGKKIQYEAKEEKDQFKLKNINIEIEANKKYALIGESGSGKTTLLKILANHLEPTSGVIQVNEKAYSNYGYGLKNLITYVSQDSFMFKDSLKNNVTLYQEYDESIVNDALHKAALDHTFQAELKDANSLSGGEKQRVSIARAVLNDTPVYLMDEVTSSLDAKVSKIIEKNLLKLENKTIIFVTHKLSRDFLEKMDCIFHIRDGEIVESGKLETLINNKSSFRELYEKNQEF